MNKKTHISFIATNFEIYIENMSFYSHSSFFIVTNYQIWVYKEIKIHFLLDTKSRPGSTFLKI